MLNCTLFFPNPVGGGRGLDAPDRRAEAEPVAQEPRRAQPVDHAPEGRPRGVRQPRRPPKEDTAHSQGLPTVQCIPLNVFSHLAIQSTSLIVTIVTQPCLRIGSHSDQFIDELTVEDRLRISPYSDFHCYYKRGAVSCMHCKANYLPKIFGGCCGTDVEHLECAIKELLKTSA